MRQVNRLITGLLLSCLLLDSGSACALSINISPRPSSAGLARSCFLTQAVPAASTQARMPALTPAAAPVTEMEAAQARQAGSALPAITPVIDEKAPRLETMEYMGRQLWILSGEHDDPALKTLFLAKVRPLILQPDPWLFLIEGADMRTTLREVRMIQSLADEKGIPIEDPIVNYGNAFLLRRVADKYPEHRASFYAYVLKTEFERLKKGVSSHQLPNLVKERVKHWGVSERVIDRGIKAFVGKDVRATEEYKRLLRDWLKEESNDYSAQAFNYLVRLYPERTNILIYCGGAHRSITKIEPPAAERVPDVEMGHILQEQKQGLGIQLRQRGPTAAASRLPAAAPEDSTNGSVSTLEWFWSLWNRTGKTSVEMVLHQAPWESYWLTVSVGVLVPVLLIRGHSLLWAGVTGVLWGIAHLLGTYNRNLEPISGRRALIPSFTRAVAGGVWTSMYAMVLGLLLSPLGPARVLDLFIPHGITLALMSIGFSFVFGFYPMLLHEKANRFLFLLELPWPFVRRPKGPPPDIQFELLNVADLNEAVTLLNQGFSFDPKASKFNRDILRRLIVSGRPPYHNLLGLVLVAKKAGYVVGLIACQRTEDKTGVHIIDFVVDPSLRRQGIGRALVQRIQEQIRIYMPDINEASFDTVQWQSPTARITRQLFGSNGSWFAHPDGWLYQITRTELPAQSNQTGPISPTPPSPPGAAPAGGGFGTFTSGPGRKTTPQAPVYAIDEDPLSWGHSRITPSPGAPGADKTKIEHDTSDRSALEALRDRNAKHWGANIVPMTELEENAQSHTDLAKLDEEFRSAEPPYTEASREQYGDEAVRIFHRYHLDPPNDKDFQYWQNQFVSDAQIVKAFRYFLRAVNEDPLVASRLQELNQYDMKAHTRVDVRWPEISVAMVSTYWDSENPIPLEDKLLLTQAAMSYPPLEFLIRIARLPRNQRESLRQDIETLHARFRRAVQHFLRHEFPNTKAFGLYRGTGDRKFTGRTTIELTDPTYFAFRKTLAAEFKSDEGEMLYAEIPLESIIGFGVDRATHKVVRGELIVAEGQYPRVRQGPPLGELDVVLKRLRAAVGDVLKLTQEGGSMRVIKQRINKSSFLVDLRASLKLDQEFARLRILLNMSLRAFDPTGDSPELRQGLNEILHLILERIDKHLPASSQPSPTHGMDSAA